MTTLERAQAKHKTAVDAVMKLSDKRDQALDNLIRAQARYRDAVKAVARSSKRLDKAREEDRQAKLARKQAKAESVKEMPSIVI